MHLTPSTLMIESTSPFPHIFMTFIISPHILRPSLTLIGDSGMTSEDESSQLGVLFGEDGLIEKMMLT